MKKGVPCTFVACPFETNVDTKPHISRHVILAKLAMRLNMLPPGLVWWPPSWAHPGLPILPKLDLFSYMVHTVLLQSHVPAVPDCSRDRNRTLPFLLQLSPSLLSSFPRTHWRKLDEQLNYSKTDSIARLLASVFFSFLSLNPFWTHLSCTVCLPCPSFNILAVLSDEVPLSTYCSCLLLVVLS